MAAPAVKGQALVIGWNGYTKSGYTTDDVTIVKGAEVEIVKGADNETLSKIISDAHDKLQGLTLIIHSGGSLVPPAIGDTFTINSVNYFVEAASIKPSRTIAKLTVDLIKEASMTYT